MGGVVKRQTNTKAPTLVKWTSYPVVFPLHLIQVLHLECNSRVHTRWKWETSNNYSSAIHVCKIQAFWNLKQQCLHSWKCCNSNFHQLLIMGGWMHNIYEAADVKEVLNIVLSLLLANKMHMIFTWLQNKSNNHTILEIYVYYIYHIYIY